MPSTAPLPQPSCTRPPHQVLSNKICWIHRPLFEFGSKQNVSNSKSPVPCNRIPYHFVNHFYHTWDSWTSNLWISYQTQEHIWKSIYPQSNHDGMYSFLSRGSHLLVLYFYILYCDIYLRWVQLWPPPWETSSGAENRAQRLKKI